MKKALRTCMLATALSLTHSGVALSATAWDHTDLYNAGGVLLSTWGTTTDTWQFDILVDGYNPATESITSAAISLNLRDDTGWWGKVDWWWEKAQLSADGSVIKTWEVDTGTKIISLTALTTLSTTGLLSMELTATKGDFYFDSATLDAHDMPAVPVPAAVWLFGSGLLGLIGVARAKRKA